jgi:uncharacterized protein (TIGR02594 family)
MEHAGAILGLHERRNKPRLKAWFDKSVSWIDPREIAWCGAYVATSMRMWQPGIGLPENPLGARQWDSFGWSVPPTFGSVLVFWRISIEAWQGHVGFYWGEDAKAYHVLGGNQSDAVTVTRIAKTRLLDARWPLNHPHKTSRILLDARGKPLSTNEA